MTGLEKLRWYGSRLVKMSPGEMAWRAGQASRQPLQWLKYKRPRFPKAQTAGAPWPVTPVEILARPAQNFWIFDLEFPATAKLQWHKDYRSGVVAPRCFSGRIDIRDPRVVGDIKYIWEINRHQHLSALAYTSEPGVCAHVAAELDSWLQENPVLTGVNWTSSLELALRTISWALIYPRIAKGVDAEFARRFADAIYAHLSQIRKNLSLFSSANNHLIGELAGLYVGACCFPFWDECAGWSQFARQGLEREIMLQVGSDGVSREQAVSYHLFSLELFLISYLIGRRLGEAFSPHYAAQLYAMLDYLDALATSGGDLPWFGDSDDARGFLLSFDDAALAVVMDLGALLLDEPRFLRSSTRPSLASRVLLADKIERWAKLKATATSEQPATLFRHGGKAVLRNKARTVQAVMDFGAHGYTSIAAHGHADALSFALALGDAYVLVDPGTYAYHSHPEWRTYFRGTAAHNTVRIDGLDQSVMGGRFLWTHQANSKLLTWNDRDDCVTVAAEHDGYSRLSDPVRHRRKLSLDKATGNFQVADTIECCASHLVEVFFHLHEDCVLLDQDAQCASFRIRKQVIRLASGTPGFTIDLRRGSENPISGWRSRKFNCKQPIYTVRIVGTISASATITSYIGFQ